MNKLFLMKLVFKNLWSRKLRTILTVLGIAVSVGFISFLASFALGLQRASTSEITDLEALQMIDVSVGRSNLVDITDEDISKFEKLGNVDLVAPHFQVAAKLELDGSSIDGITYGKISSALLLEDLTMLSGVKSINKDNILITSSTLKQLGIENYKEALYKEIKIILVPKADVLEETAKEDTKELSLPIGGVIENDNSAFVYINLKHLKSLGFIKYDGVKIQMLSKDDVPLAKEKIESMGFKVTSIKETVDQVNQFFVIFQMILVLIGAIAVIVACIGMFNTLTINLLEKTREVGFMKVLGTRRKDISFLFLTESIVIGISGGVLGVLTSYILGISINLAIIELARGTGNSAVELFYMPPSYMLIAIASIIIISILTGLWPSIRASKIDPLNAMRYE